MVSYIEITSISRDDTSCVKSFHLSAYQESGIKVTGRPQFYEQLK